MSRNATRHLPPSPQFDVTGSKFDTPQRRKLEFARRLQARMTEKGWSQAELGRQASIARDLISTYVRARSLPEPVNAKKLANALGCSLEELLPWTAAEAAVGAAHGSLEMYEAPGHPGQVWLRLERMISLQKATAILALLEDNPHAEDMMAEASGD